MAKENGAPTAAEKGKGKAEEATDKNGIKKTDDVKKDKDGKPLANGKGKDEPDEGLYSPRKMEQWELIEYATFFRGAQRRGSDTQE